MVWEHMASPTPTTDTRPQKSPRLAEDSLASPWPPATAHGSSAVAAPAQPAPPVTNVGSDSSVSVGQDVPQWQLASCKVSPAFGSTDSDELGGALTEHLDLHELTDQTLGIGEFMVWANEGVCAPPRGFHLLVRYTETLTLQHDLATSQVKFRLAKWGPAELGQQCTHDCTWPSLHQRRSGRSKLCDQGGKQQQH